MIFVGSKGYHPVSIHAPARGATSIEEKLKLKEEFQSTLLREERLLNYNYLN